MPSFEIGPPDDKSPMALGSVRASGWTPPAAPFTPQEGPVLSLPDLVSVLRRNVWMILVVMIAVSAGVAYLISREVAQYRATASFRWVDAQRELAGGILGGGGAAADPILSQIEVLRGREVVGAVVDREGLRLIPQSRGGERVSFQGVRIAAADATDTLRFEFDATGVTVRSAKGGSAQAAYGTPLRLPGVELAVRSRPQVEAATVLLISRDAAVDRTIAGLSAKQRSNTDAVDVQFSAPDPGLAQRVVNAAVDVFRDVSARGAQTQSRRRRLFLEQQLVTVDSNYQTIQSELSSFRSRSQVYSPTAKMDARQQGLIDLDVRREDLVANRQQLSTLLAQIQRAGSDDDQLTRVLSGSPTVAASPALGALQAELAGYLKSREDRTTGPLAVTAQHPDVQRLDAAIRSMPAKLVDAVRGQLSVVDTQIGALDTLRARYSGEIAQLSGTEADETRLVQELATARTMSDQLRAELQRTRIAEAVEVGGVEVINYAPVPPAPLTSGRLWKLMLGMAMGLALGSGLAFFRESLNTSIRRREDVEEALHVPGLGVIPHIARVRGGKRLLETRGGKQRGTEANGGAGRPRAPSELVMLSDLHSSSAEAFRVLRTNLLFSRPTATLKTIAVTSATPGEGKSTTVANLAVTFAQQGLRVLLIDCDLRRSRLHHIFGLPIAPGLTELVRGETPTALAVRASETEGLSILPAGTLPQNPAELLGGRRMNHVLQVLSSEFDLVLLDTPPVMAAADAAILGARVDGVVLVIRAGGTDRGAAQFAIQQLQGVGAKVVGAVLNDPDAQVARYGGYINYEYYGAEQAMGR